MLVHVVAADCEGIRGIQGGEEPQEDEEDCNFGRNPRNTCIS